MCTHVTVPSLPYLGKTEEVVQSSEGVQQGDPLGLLLFCLAIHRLTQSLKSELCVCYLDDGTLGVSKADLLHDLDLIKNAAVDLGLPLNLEKSELVCNDQMLRDLFLSSIPSLLGSPLGDADSISDSKCCT